MDEIGVIMILSIQQKIKKAIKEEGKFSDLDDFSNRSGFDLAISFIIV